MELNANPGFIAGRDEYCAIRGVVQKKMSAIRNKKEQDVLLAQPDTRYPVELRNLCLLHLGLKCGLRVLEQIALEWTQVDLSRENCQLIDTGEDVRGGCSY